MLPDFKSASRVETNKDAVCLFWVYPLNQKDCDAQFQKIVKKSKTLWTGLDDLLAITKQIRIEVSTLWDVRKILLREPTEFIGEKTARNIKTELVRETSY